ncbi:MAG: threonine-phosphate decarboxylase [Roseitalea sp.]|jgi:cobalamin biosynthetic protein CobC|nr:threonine-phosphate decarboxylase [Roseitalea sp.]MBO6721316.1 threonine-phosphate decarboxylase [Roseitalea sp.]MBO6742199.1 threonine-phosphate decarboxylase [Roseitalea sp.]
MARPPHHGGSLDRAVAEHGGVHADWLDLSTGINPVPWPVPPIPAEVWERLPEASLEDYCLDAARAYYGVPEGASIVAAPGTQAIIQRLGDLIGTNRRIGIVTPTYGEYDWCLATPERVVGTVRAIPSYEDGYDGVVFGNPNNPDGARRDGETDREAVAALLARNGTVIVDEAFADVAPEASYVPQTGSEGLIVLRSFGKFFGLAGIRLGFAIGPQGDMARLRRLLGPWAVPGPALYIGGRALRDIAWIAETRTRLMRDRQRLTGLLERHGFSITGQTDLFVLANHDRAPAIAKALADTRIWVRAFDKDAAWLRFGLPGADVAFKRLEKALAQAV